LAHQRLKKTEEKVKIELCAALTSDVNLPLIAASPSGHKHLQLKIFRATFEGLISSPKQLIDPFHQCLSDTGVQKSDISEFS